MRRLSSCVPSRWPVLVLLLPFSLRAAQSYETAPVRPQGSDYVPPPFTAVRVLDNMVECLGRQYDLSRVIPAPRVGGMRVLRESAWTVNGRALTPPPCRWTLLTPAVVRAERSWRVGDVQFELTQVVEYDGFVTVDLTVAPVPGRDACDLRESTLVLEYRPELSQLYHIPVFRPVWAGHWPESMNIDTPVVGVWGGEERAGLASYVASYRAWRGADPRLTLGRGSDGAGTVVYRVVSEPMSLTRPIRFRFGFIATPVRPLAPGHLRLYSLTTSQPESEQLVDCLTLWGGLSDYYATFRTNRPEDDATKIALVRDLKAKDKAVLAYTTYAHVEDTALEAPVDWCLLSAQGRTIARSIGGGMKERNRVFLCPGSADWIDWKEEDLRVAVERLGVDGFYVDTSYIILPCANAAHDHGWLGPDGKRQSDYPVWSMRAVWRRAYELLCRARGGARIYAHHKGGCPAALTAYTTVFCDGEQFTSVPITHLTLDGFRAQVCGRNMGCPGFFLNEYYRSAHYGHQQAAKHHNPTEALMLALPHDTLCTGYPGIHPARELIELRDDLGLDDAEWTPYYAPGRQWRVVTADDAAVSTYRNARGDTVLVVSNPTYEPMSVALDGPEAARAGRTFVALDVLSRLGRASAGTPGYRWEPADASALQVGARSFGLYAFVRTPETLAGFAEKRGFAQFATGDRRTAVPEGVLLVDDFDDPDWVLVNDDGDLAASRASPVDTRAALRVQPQPKHRAAALLLQYAEPEDWAGYAYLTFWVRPDVVLPVRALDLRLRNADTYGRAMELVSHPPDATLQAGKWEPLRYDCRALQRDHVRILRVYYHRGDLCSGPFELDEMLLWPAGAGQGARAAESERPTDAEGQAVPD